MKTETPDRMNIQTWAKNRADEMRDEIKFHIKEGMKKSKAVDMVLNDSCIGKGYKSQIRYEFKEFA